MTDATAPAGDPGDTDLMERVRGGETERLSELFERHHRRLYAFFVRLVRSGSVAEDLVQEVFVRMLKYRQTFRPGAAFEPWMFTLARNTAADHWRRGPREVAIDPEAPEPAADLPHPIAGMEKREESARLRAALARLDPDRRELLLLARSGERPYASIGEMLGISTGAVKLRVHRAMKELRAAFEAVGESRA